MVFVLPHFVIAPVLSGYTTLPCLLLCVRVCVCARTYTADFSIIKWSCDLIVERVVQSLMLEEE